MATSPTQILDVACRLFAQRGLQGVTTAELCTAARTSPGTLFRHVVTREALLAQAFDHAHLHLCIGIHGGAAFPHDTVYDTIRRAWTVAAERALAAPHLFAYWVLARATPGLGLAQPGLVQLRAFQQVDQLLAHVLATSALQAGLLAYQLEAQWVATLQYILQLPTGMEDARPEAAALLAQGYAQWWAGVGLAREVPFPQRAS